MKKKRSKRSRIYPVIWSGIIVVSIYLFVRLFTLSFSDNFGQANLKLLNSIFSGMSCKAMEEGSSLISYAKVKKGKYTFPIQMASDQLALADFADNSNIMTVKAQEYSPMMKENNAKADTNGSSVETMSTGGVLDDIYNLPEKYLSTEYILSNGAIYNSDMTENTKADDPSDELQVGYEDGGIKVEETEDNGSSDDDSTVQTANTGDSVVFTKNQLKDTNYLVHNFYIVDSSTKVTKKLFDAEKLLNLNMKLKQDNDKPQILIYHTHSQEGYRDSKSGKKSDTVVGAGDVLTKILEDKYGYNVIHDTTTYDVVNGVENRDVAYSKAEDGLTKILKDNPTIEVVIDLHRDSGKAQTVKVDGKEAAKIMLFNGLSRGQNGPINYLYNPNLQGNLAFSLQLQIESMKLYPGLFKRNYLKSYRYNMHVRPKSLLVELGTVGDTVQSAKNAMEPFAKVLDAVLQGK